MATTAAQFTRWEEYARRLSYTQLISALHDTIDTALAMDQLDHAMGGDRAGRYRDEASVYRRELQARERSAQCPHCGRV